MCPPTCTLSLSVRIRTGRSSTPRARRFISTSRNVLRKRACTRTSISMRTWADASWNDEEGRWYVTTPDTTYIAQFLITGTGHLADEAFPDVPGLDTFPGDKFHSARWDHSKNLEGKRIGVVGTGASAIQLVPDMEKIASELVVFQRTPSYVTPRMEHTYTEGEKRQFQRDPDAIPNLRATLFWTGENGFAARKGIPRFLEENRKVALDHLANQVEDPELREKLTPKYEPGCKRVLISNTYYPAIASEKTTLEDSALVRVDGSKAVAASGEEYELDALIFATGFEASEPPYAELIHGHDGLNLSEYWSQGMQAYQSITVANFPNLFSINGPNTSLGHNSIVYIIEAQIDYVLGAYDYIEKNQIATLEPTEEAEEGYADQLQSNAKGTVWLDGGCNSWYLDQRSGRLTLIYPDFAYAFRDHNGTFTPELHLRHPCAGLSSGLRAGRAHALTMPPSTPQRTPH
ncbi:Putative flavoprotein involved in K+ transport [Corynebacterium camporealensis]|nr:Putative flavoprotein involved in K+ transport [Corynebacterium camporealensis]